MTRLLDLCHWILFVLLLVLWASLGWWWGVFFDWLFNWGVA